MRQAFGHFQYPTPPLKIANRTAAARNNQPQCADLFHRLLTRLDGTAS
jgi:hypothetical protein